MGYEWKSQGRIEFPPPCFAILFGNNAKSGSIPGIERTQYAATMGKQKSYMVLRYQCYGNLYTTPSANPSVPCTFDEVFLS